MDTNKIIEKIKLLQTAAEGRTPEEAALFAAKAQDLLLKYNLTASEIKDEPVPGAIKLDVLLSDTNSWVSWLFNGIATTHGCCVVQTNTPRRGTTKQDRIFSVFGRPANVEVVNYLATYLRREIRRLAAATHGTNAYRRSFASGATTTVLARLRESLQTFQSTDESRALIVVMDAEAQALKNATFPKLTNARKSSFSPFGYSAGREAGKGIALRHGVAGARNSGGQLLLGGPR